MGDVSAITHHAIVPTGIRPTYLAQDVKHIYTLIVARTLESLSPHCRKKTTHVEATCGNLVLTSSVSEVRHLGWRSILGREEDREEGEIKQGDNIPIFVKGESVRIIGWNLLTRKTQPQPFHTETTLLSAMERLSFGTPETRTAIIETLLAENYIQQWEQDLVPTEKGLYLYNCLKNKSITDIELTESWEKALQNVGLGKQKADSFMTMFEIFTKQVVVEILTPQKICPQSP